MICQTKDALFQGVSLTAMPQSNISRECFIPIMPSSYLLPFPLPPPSLFTFLVHFLPFSFIKITTHCLFRSGHYRSHDNAFLRVLAYSCNIICLKLSLLFYFFNQILNPPPPPKKKKKINLVLTFIGRLPACLSFFADYAHPYHGWLRNQMTQY